MPMGGGSSTTTTTKELSPEQRSLLDPVIPIAKDYLNTPLQLFPGSTIAGPTETQGQAREMISGAAQGGVSNLANSSLGTALSGQQMGVGAGAAGLGQLLRAGQTGSLAQSGLVDEFARTTGARDFLSSGALMNPGSNPFLAAQTEAAIDPIAGRLMEDVLPRLDAGFAANNMFGSSRQGIAQGQAVDDFMREAGDVSTRLGAENFRQGLGAMLSTAGGARDAALGASGQGIDAAGKGAGQGINFAIQSMMASPNLAELAFLPGMTMESLGRVEQQENQARLSEQANRFMTEQMLPFMQAQDVAGLALGLNNESTIAESQVPAPDPLGQIMGSLFMLPFL